jgi:hypothetical protein
MKVIKEVGSWRRWWPAKSQGTDNGGNETQVVHEFTSGSDLRARTLATQESVKWFAGTLTGVAVTLGLGARIEDIPKLGGSDEAYAVGLTVFGLLCVAVGIWLAFRVLLPNDPSIANSADDLVVGGLLIATLPKLSELWVEQDGGIPIDDPTIADNVLKDPKNEQEKSNAVDNAKCLDDAIQGIGSLAMISTAVATSTLDKERSARLALRHRQLVEAQTSGSSDRPAL